MRQKPGSNRACMYVLTMLCAAGLLAGCDTALTGNREAPLAVKSGFSDALRVATLAVPKFSLLKVTHNSLETRFELPSTNGFANLSLKKLNTDKVLEALMSLTYNYPVPHTINRFPTPITGCFYHAINYA